MSVINKMLRDLDSRQAAGTNPVSEPEAGTAMARGTRIVNESGRAGRQRALPRFAVVMVATVLVLGGAAAGWWYLNQSLLPQRQVPQREVAQARVAATAPPQSTPTVASAVNPLVTASATVAPVVAVAPVMAVVPVVPIPALPVVAKLPVPVAPAGAAPAVASLKMDSTFSWAPSLGAVSGPKAAGVPRTVPERSLPERSITPTTTIPSVASTVPPSPPRQLPALEVLAQAQSLWSAGSHEAAIDLLHEALAATERASLAGAPAGNHAVLASLARELARMELAQGRVSQVLQMLTRLEPALSGVADVWAIRGNAAQRLGRHQESAAAYLTALKLRPGEPRWMLGAAVSLAAQGQTAAAAELAEKARADGVLSPEVATYLRQLGVPLRER